MLRHRSGELPMPDKATDSPTPPPQSTPGGDASRSRDARHDDGLTNPRDGRGPLRPRNDQAAKLPLRPPH
jgi:hypothetical protein